MPKNKISVNLNLNVRGLQPSATLAINEKSNEIIAQGRKVYKLGLGQSPFPVPTNVVKALEENSFQKDYLPVKGLGALRESVAKFNQRNKSLPSTADDILIGPGSKELLFLLQLVYYGDLIIPSPGWVSYSPQARIVGRNVHWIHTSKENDWLLSPEQLDFHCRVDPSRPRILILNYPSNPTGKTYKKNQLARLAKVAAKYGVVVLSDEIYGLLDHNGDHVSIANFYPEGTIVSSGLSKWCGAGGWRLGTFSFPKSLNWLLDAMSIVASETYTATSAPIQYAAITAFDGGEEIEKYLNHSRKILTGLADYLYRRSTKMGLELAKPDGAFYLFPDFGKYREQLAEKGILTSVELTNRILNDIGVAMLPGFDFGIDPENLNVRMAYVDFDGTKALESSFSGAEINDEFVRSHAPRIVESFDLIENWLKGL